ncbi:type II secretion system F family protein [Candidatus Kaiserbacteria bacterium]|nr:MAG: type II secretion system F family protein [Candidatus Kaiserbacteria bacterium]
MALFYYTAVDRENKERKGSIDAINKDVAITALQRRGLTLSSINPAESSSIFDMRLTFFERVKNKDIVILSRQITTLFEAQVSALRAFRLLSAESTSPLLQDKLGEVANDIQSGSTIADALGKHPKIFSSFYVEMVRAGEETGRLGEAFEFLADYLDRTYAVTSKARNALIYPAFVIMTFVAVMVLMLTTVIPRLSDILLESGQDIPVYTKVVIGFSQFLTNYFWLFGIGILFGVGLIYRFLQTESGKQRMARARLQIPYLGDLYRKLYMSRIADSLSTTLSSGIQLVRGMEISAAVVGDPAYDEILKSVAQEIQSGRPASEVMAEYSEFPGIVIAMIKVGEETGDLSNILKTMAKFYQREVSNAVDTLVSLIEPMMIVLMGLGVGLLLASVLVPIYNISAGL